MEKFIYQADHLAKYRAKMAVKVLNREISNPVTVSDFATLLSAISLLFI